MAVVSLVLASMGDSRPGLMSVWIRSRSQVVEQPQRLPLARGIIHVLNNLANTASMLAKWRILGLPATESLLVSDQFDLLDAAISLAESNGLWLEFGVFKGASINHIARRTSVTVFGFDSFEGLPEYWRPTYPKHSLFLGGVEPVVDNRVTLVKGYFDSTLPAFLKQRPGMPVSFLHIDCDLYSSTRTVLTNLGDRIGPGTVVVFDEFCGMMPDDEARAWREYCRSYRASFRWIGCSLKGSVALRVTSTLSDKAPA